MEHDLAANSNAVERYILGELTPAERDAFEDHYFSCEACADDVRTLTLFVDNAKAVLREPFDKTMPLATAAAATARPAPRGWFGWLQPQFAFGSLAAAFALVIGLQMSTISRLTQPVAGPLAVLHGESRGDIPSVPAGGPLSLVLALEEHPEPGTPLAPEIRSDSGQLLYTLKSAAPQKDQALSVFIRDPKLKSGRYTVVIGNIKYPFEIR
jgi:hypothetical protein